MGTGIAECTQQVELQEHAGMGELTRLHDADTHRVDTQPPPTIHNYLPYKKDYRCTQIEFACYSQLVSLKRKV